MSDEHVLPMQVAMLGTDAIIAAGTVEPVQLWRACQNIGFDFVIPVSWGEELIATWIGARVAEQAAGAVVVSTCPLVDERIRATPVKTPVVRTVSPPVATARYLRAALQPRAVEVTYVGACPGAKSKEVNAHLTPEQLFARFVEAGVDAGMQPRHFDGYLPPERARYASLPGGIPATDWLALQGIRLIEAAPITVDTVCQAITDEKVVIDLAAACFCACARNRSRAARLEPPRTFVPVVMNLGVPVGENGAATDIPDSPPASPDPAAPARATFAENGLSAGEAAPLPEPVTTEDLLTTKEPW
jgi:hypothetical protein